MGLGVLCRDLTSQSGFKIQTTTIQQKFNIQIMEIGTKGLNLDSVRKGEIVFLHAAQSPQFDRFSKIRYLPKDTCEKAHAPVHGTVCLRRHGGERAQTRVLPSGVLYRRENLAHSRDREARQT